MTPGRETDLTDVDGSASPDGTPPPGGDDLGDATSDDGGSGAMPTPDDTKDQWGPDLMVEELDTGLVVTGAAPSANGWGPRLFGGDCVGSIDGTQVGSMEGWQAMELLYGPEGLDLLGDRDRSATGETVMVSMPRIKPGEDGSGEGDE